MRTAQALRGWQRLLLRPGPIGSALLAWTIVFVVWWGPTAWSWWCDHREVVRWRATGEPPCPRRGESFLEDLPFKVAIPVGILAFGYGVIVALAAGRAVAHRHADLVLGPLPRVPRSSCMADDEMPTMGLPLLTIAVATLTFLAVGADIRWCGILLALFPVTAGIGLARSRRPVPRSGGLDARPTLAVALAFAVTWLGLAFHTESFDWSEPQHHEAWRHLHGASNEHYRTGMVGGFPLQAVEGHGSGGAPEFLPAGKGLGALLANFGLLFAACAVAAYFVPRRVAMGAAWIAVLAAPACGFLGFRVLVVMLD